MPGLALTVLVLSAGCSDKPSAPDSQTLQAPRAGGATTVDNATSNAFSTPAPNLTGSGLDKHLAGDANFEVEFVAAPAVVHGGLGPVFNSNSCVSCHPRDGRGRPPSAGEQAQSLLMRLSQDGTDPATGGPNPVPGFGTQLFDKSLFGTTTPGRLSVSYSEVAGRFADGTEYWLRAPQYTLVDLYQPLPGAVLLSPRVAPPVFGRGLLEAVDEMTVIGLSDPGDADGDGISGRPNYVWDHERGQAALGRFGWKANQPTLRQQVAAAYRGDMGITTPYFPVESSHGWPQFDGLGDDPEISGSILEETVFYVQTLAVPARRRAFDAEVRRGEALFEQARCTGCHVPTLTTGALPGVPEVSLQAIHPYTDMLLHDLGDGLADGRPDFQADGREWRTPPLWGIGLTYIVNGHTFFLHDGRARNLEEAILWHGGEADSSRRVYIDLEKSDRDALLAFLESL